MTIEILFHANENTILFYNFVQKKNESLAEILMNNKANISAEDENGNSPLHIAAQEGKNYSNIIFCRVIKKNEFVIPFHKKGIDKVVQNLLKY